MSSNNNISEFNLVHNIKGRDVVKKIPKLIQVPGIKWLVMPRYVFGKNVTTIRTDALDKNIYIYFINGPAHLNNLHSLNNVILLGVFRNDGYLTSVNRIYSPKSKLIYDKVERSLDIGIPDEYFDAAKKVWDNLEKAEAPGYSTYIALGSDESKTKGQRWAIFNESEGRVGWIDSNGILYGKDKKLWNSTDDSTSEFKNLHWKAIGKGFNGEEGAKKAIAVIAKGLSADENPVAQVSHKEEPNLSEVKIRSIIRETIYNLFS